MIGRAMETWPDEALRRVVDAPLETWGMHLLFNPHTSPPTSCLLGHAVDAASYRCELELSDEAAKIWQVEGFEDSIGDRFDRLASRFGIARTVRAIKARTLRILESRDPSLGEPTPQVQEVALT